MLGLERFLTSGEVGGVFGDEVSADGDREVFRRVVDNDKDCNNPRITQLTVQNQSSTNQY